VPLYKLYYDTSPSVKLGVLTLGGVGVTCVCECMVFVLVW